MSGTPTVVDADPRSDPLRPLLLPAQPHENVADGRVQGFGIRIALSNVELQRRLAFTIGKEVLEVDVEGFEISSELVAHEPSNTLGHGRREYLRQDTDNLLLRKLSFEFELLIDEIAMETILIDLAMELPNLAKLRPAQWTMTLGGFGRAIDSQPGGSEGPLCLRIVEYFRGDLPVDNTLHEIQDRSLLDQGVLAAVK